MGQENAKSHITRTVLGHGLHTRQKNGTSGETAYEHVEKELPQPRKAASRRMFIGTSMATNIHYMRIGMLLRASRGYAYHSDVAMCPGRTEGLLCHSHHRQTRHTLPLAHLLPKLMKQHGKCSHCRSRWLQKLEQVPPGHWRPHPVRTHRQIQKAGVDSKGPQPLLC